MRVNGDVADSISIRDRGLLYGDGVFRTMLAEQGKLRHWPSHLKKLQQDCQALGINCPTPEQLAVELQSILLAHPQGVIKLIVTRGQGGRGYAPPAVQVPHHVWDVFPLPEYPEEWRKQGIKLRLCDVRLSHQPRLAGIKHLNRLENVLAAAEWQAADIAEGVLLDIEGNLIEGTRSNLFFVRGGHLCTPDLSRCGVAGVQRERVLSWAASRGISVEMGHFPVEALAQAEEVFLVNSVIGLWPVQSFQQRRWTDFPLAFEVAEYLAGAHE
jgi:4-amino-4-deoxychorismate lyase